MSSDAHVTVRSLRIEETANPLLRLATGALVLTAIAIAMVIMAQHGVLPWTLSEIDPAGAVGSLPNI